MTETAASHSARQIDRKMLELLVCPLTKTTLEYDANAQELISRAAKLAYPIKDGIPVMLPDEARKIED
ncbi:Trm112 family protein [Pannonibacter indicus]|jgi:uncharacterized protein YbaR (Trm112 family)|uniref:UPF0434 protein Ga0061067_106123 n=1 Tax=Pannonibacter indicus TaxID=466044 RepID=A0A0K6I0L9_9HYPH|nr:Trm112 family protein [Pannonibacter indicus]CUA96847.1 Uncharacterized conserved protein YbaR, Trm112 family [Pannonibacter indicus]